MGRKIEIDEKDRLKKHMLLDKLMDGCYIEPITKSFYCKKCDCIVTIDWIKNEAYCVTDGVICSCIKDEDVKEPVTITQDGKVWLLLDDIEDSDEAAELTEFVRTELDIPDDKLEAAIENGWFILLSILTYVLARNN